MLLVCKDDATISFFTYAVYEWPLGAEHFILHVTLTLVYADRLLYGIAFYTRNDLTTY